MTIKNHVRRRMEQLIEEGATLALDTDDGWCRNEQQISKCQGWLAAANNVLCLICPVPNDAYRKASELILNLAAVSEPSHKGRYVGQITELLKRLLADIDDGLLASVANQARAETFDDLLDHAQSYLDENRKEGSGVLASAVFEDTVRRIGEGHDRKTSSIWLSQPSPNRT